MALSVIDALATSHVDPAMNIRRVLPIEMAVFFFACLARSDELKAAHESVPRGLGIP